MLARIETIKKATRATPATTISILSIQKQSLSKVYASIVAYLSIFDKRGGSLTDWKNNVIKTEQSIKLVLAISESEENIKLMFVTTEIFALC